MDFRIADTFTDSLSRLTGDEQKSVKTTAFDLQLNPANPGMSLHKLDAARDKSFWSVRVDSDIRLIVHKTSGSLLLCYVDHHDKAYRWAERRKLETHPSTGAAQFVEIRERVQEIVVPRAVEAADSASPLAPTRKPLLFTTQTDADLLGYGVPPEWLPDVRAADEDSLLVLADHLPAEAAEALLELATGGQPQRAKPPADTRPFDHPDAQRRFRTMHNAEELERALAYPWEKWAVFLHPAQRQWVEKDYSGPARVAGSAGTGKTIVALHRAVFLAQQHADARVLLTTFSDTLAHALRTQLRRLVSHQPRLAERLEVHAMDAIGQRLYGLHLGPLRLADANDVRTAVAAALAERQKGGDALLRKLSPNFVLAEWQDLVDAWQLADWPAYRDVKRLGRKTRLSEPQRASLWSVFERVHQRLHDAGLVTPASMFTRLAQVFAALPKPPFDFVVVDEAQDMAPSQLRCLAALGAQAGQMRPNSLFFAGDLGQRIFQTPFSWKALGVDVRGRSRTLHINYRTSHQIRRQADRLLGPEVSDVDGNTEDRRGTVSVFNGPAPQVLTFGDEATEVAGVAQWLNERRAQGVAPHELAVFVRAGAQLPRAEQVLLAAGVPWRRLDERVDTVHGQASVCTMHLAKGLEFRAVVVMACDDEVLPLQERIEQVSDEADLQEVYATERHLLYVACTRARDHLLVTSTRPASEFLADLNAGST